MTAKIHALGPLRSPSSPGTHSSQVSRLIVLLGQLSPRLPVMLVVKSGASSSPMWCDLSALGFHWPAPPSQPLPSAGLLPFINLSPSLRSLDTAVLRTLFTDICIFFYLFVSSGGIIQSDVFKHQLPSTNLQCELCHLTSVPYSACMLSCSVMSDFLWPPWTAVHQSFLSMGFFRQEYWSA